MHRVLAIGLAVVGLPYVSAVGWLALEQRSLLYRPGAGPETPEDAGLQGFRLERLATADGLEIPVWRRDPAVGKPLVVHFHGNGGGLYGSAARLARLAEAGFGIAAMEYRGYPGAPGTPSQTALTADAVALLDRLAREGVPPQRIALYGWSLGSAVALQAAARRPVGALVLEAPPTAIVDRAAELYPVVPVRWLMADPWLSRDVIGEIRRPMLILHGALDGVVPIAHGRRLAALAKDRAVFVEFPAAGHVDIDRHGGLDRMIEFLDGLPR
jgi:pimeloyl-ACP methyl ester carboxylesterase